MKANMNVNEDALGIELTAEKIKADVLPRFLSKKRAEDLADKEAIIMNYLGLPVGLYLPMPGMSDDSQNASIVITEHLLESFDLSKEELYHCAVKNMAKQAEICSFGSVLMGLSSLISEDIPVSNNEPPVWFVSNKKRFFGAAAILCPSVLEELSKRVGGDLMILPSSVHEALVMSMQDGLDQQTASDMVRDINASAVAPQDRLFDGVLIYRHGIMEMCAA